MSKEVALKGNMELAVASALDQYRMAKAREAMLMGPGGFLPGMGGTTSPGLDAKRQQSWQEFGYPTGLFFIDFFKLYARGGIAAGCVNKLAGRCWNTNPWLSEGDKDEKDDKVTAWEDSLKPVLRQGRLWRAFAEADKRRLVGRYSGLILRIRDNKALSQPVTKSEKRGLLEVVPAWAGSLVPSEYVTEENAENYGDVKMWKYRQPSVGANGAAKDVDVHPDRVFILGSWRSDSIGFLEPVFNNFVNLEKTEGGSGESILKNSARTLHVNFDGTVDLRNLAAMYGVDINGLQEKFNDAAREVNHGNDILFVTQGATANPMVANVPDPKPIHDVNLMSVSAGTDIPTKIIIGNQSGERASTEDEAYMNRRCQSRQNNELVYEITDFFEKIIALGIVEPPPKGEFVVNFDDLTEPTLGEKLDNADKMATVNQKITANGMGAEVFSRKQILGVTGFEDDIEDPEAREQELADRVNPSDVPEDEEDEDEQDA